MRVIIIGAGRGQRLMPTTKDTPKCFAQVQSKRILDWTLEAFRAHDLTEFCFIGGYQIEKVQQEYPDFTFRHNEQWETNNILESLMCAEDLMVEPFICCYSDTLFTADVVGKVLASDADISLVVDTNWLERYEHRTEHPPDDAEKVVVEGEVVRRVHRGIAAEEAHGEYAGVAKFSHTGGAALRDYYRRRRQQYAGQPYREAVVFEKAYLILLLQDMIENGERMVSVDTPGGYIEIDTQQDFELANEQWGGEA
jgi:choline kinase